jgi:hypothetical protein
MAFFESLAFTPLEIHQKSTDYSSDAELLQGWRNCEVVISISNGAGRENVE